MTGDSGNSGRGNGGEGNGGGGNGGGNPPPKETPQGEEGEGDEGDKKKLQPSDQTPSPTPKGGGRSAPTGPVTDPTKARKPQKEDQDFLPPDPVSRQVGKKSVKLDYQRRRNLERLISELGSSYAIPPNVDLSDDKVYDLHQGRLEAEYRAKQEGLKLYSVPKNLDFGDRGVFREHLRLIKDMGRTRRIMENRQREVAELKSIADPVDRLQKAFLEAYESGKISEEMWDQLSMMLTREALESMAWWIAAMWVFSGLTGGTGAAATLGVLIALLGPGIMPLAIGMYNVTTAEIPEEYELGVEQIIKGIATLGVAGLLAFLGWLGKGAVAKVKARITGSRGASPKPVETPAGGKGAASGEAATPPAPKPAASPSGAAKPKRGSSRNGNGASGRSLEDFRGADVTPGPGEATGGVVSRLPRTGTKPGASRLPPAKKASRIKVHEPVEVMAGGKNPAGAANRSPGSKSPQASRKRPKRKGPSEVQRAVEKAEATRLRQSGGGGGRRGAGKGVRQDGNWIRRFKQLLIESFRSDKDGHGVQKRGFPEFDETGFDGKKTKGNFRDLDQPDAPAELLGSTQSGGSGAPAKINQAAVDNLRSQADR